jgi:hypothetical protein
MMWFVNSAIFQKWLLISTIHWAKEKSLKQNRKVENDNYQLGECFTWRTDDRSLILLLAFTRGHGQSGVWGCDHSECWIYHAETWVAYLKFVFRLDVLLLVLFSLYIFSLFIENWEWPKSRWFNATGETNLYLKAYCSPPSPCPQAAIPIIFSIYAPDHALNIWAYMTAYQFHFFLTPY